MPKFFIAATNIFGGVAYLDKKDAEHLRVLRVKQGEILTVCDGRGTDYTCVVKNVGPDSAEAEIINTKPASGEPDVACTIFAAFPKGDKAEIIIQKCVELGASGIVFFQSERCVSRPDETSAIKKIDRWNKISEEASKQSGRGLIPPVSLALSFGKMVAEAAKAEAGFFLWEEEKECSLKAALNAAGDNFKTAAIVTGPEGGFEKNEAARAAEAGLKTVTLGARILRCETAPLCALTALMYHTDNLS